MTARILVVDDILPNVKLLEAKLTAEYFDVLTASDGASALELADAETPDIILLDVMMPGMDGFEACERLKANPKTRHIPVVMVTALSDVNDRVRGLKAGADDFLSVRAGALAGAPQDDDGRAPGPPGDHRRRGPLRARDGRGLTVRQRTHPGR
jgi:CheY-like chemotaxis protein